MLDEGEPKYLNSPETPLFEKGRELYGLYQARRAIRDAGRVLVVEGYMDVVALAQHGIEYAVATLGTATTPTHVQKLLRQADDVVFCFDGDDAGPQGRVARARDQPAGRWPTARRCAFCSCREGEDPGHLRAQAGKDAFEKLLDEAEPLSQFLLAELSAARRPCNREGRAALVAEAKPLSTQITAPALGAMLRQEPRRSSPGLSETVLATSSANAASKAALPAPWPASRAPSRSAQPAPQPRPRARPVRMLGDAAPELHASAELAGTCGREATPHAIRPA